LPQSRIDFIWTTQAGGVTESRVIAQDLPLLGVQSKEGGAAIVTVAAKSDDAEKLAQAAAQGTLKLVVRMPQKRNTGHTENTEKTQIDWFFHVFRVFRGSFLLFLQCQQIFHHIYQLVLRHKRQ